MKTFGDWRRSRYLTQREAAILGRLSLITVKRWEMKAIDRNIWSTVTDIEGELERPESAQVVGARSLNAFTLAPMTSRQVRRLPIGMCFILFAYYNPGEVETAQLRQARPDLHAKARAYLGKRAVVLYRCLTSRHSTKKLLRVADIRSPTLVPLESFKPSELV